MKAGLAFPLPSRSPDLGVGLGELLSLSLCIK